MAGDYAFGGPSARRLDGKVVLITGAGSGLGRESAQLFAHHGARVLITDKDEERANEVLNLVDKQGGEAIAVRADVRVESDVEQAVARAVEHFGQLDVVFANSGVIVDGRGAIAIDDLTEAQWDDVHAVNLKGVFFSIKHAVRAMKPHRRGTILCTSSAASLVAYPGMNAYQATKGGVNALVKSLSMELGPFGIRINAICPTHGMSPNFFLGEGYPVVGMSYEEMHPWDNTISPIPLKLDRPPGLRDNANAALFLVSDDSAYMSGVCLPTTDGGTLSKVAMEFGEDWLEQTLAAALPPEASSAPPASG